MARRTITARTIRRCDWQVRRRRGGAQRALRQLERDEHLLASYLMERATQLYGLIDAACPRHADVRRIQRELLALALTCVEAVRRSR
jgi:hypothetical protein